MAQHNPNKEDTSDSYVAISGHKEGHSQLTIRLCQSPFVVNNTTKYKIWRKEKLLAYPINFDNFIVNVESLNRITDEERALTLDRCKRYNMVIYKTDTLPVGPADLKLFATHFGLESLDQHFCHDAGGITALQVSEENNKGGFIPYSNRALNWHTDGYYNALDQQIHGVLLHCDTPAYDGGVNSFMDHEMAYICLRDENPAYIDALMHENAMTIPAHVENGKELRPEQSGPVFSLSEDGKRLHMRYSQRKRHIIWRDDPVLREAVAFLDSLLSDDNKYVLQIKLQRGQGILSNNVLHNRSAFKDSENHPRLIYRARFFEFMI